jgi:putative aminopeptidase FrvX
MIPKFMKRTRVLDVLFVSAWVILSFPARAQDSTQPPAGQHAILTVKGEVGVSGARGKTF